MSLFYQHNINEGTKLGIWRIEEPEEFFLAKVPLKKEVTHPYKRLQHLAGRYLLPELFDDFPLEQIKIADTRKPFLEDEQYHFSISHCGNFAAALVSNSNRVGVDVERVTPRILSIAGKFLSDAEKLFMSNWVMLSAIELELTTVLWSAKESIFKWYGNGGIDFRKHMQLHGAISFGADEWMKLPFVFSKEARMPLTIHAKLFDQLALAWVVS